MSTVDVLVVGGGPAGLSAATALARTGASVTVVERELKLGGIPRHTDHLGFGLRDLHRCLTGPRYAQRLIDAADLAGVELRASTTVSAIGESVALATPNGPDEVTAKAVVLATGVRERPRAARLVPGDRPAGVLTTGALQQLAAFHQQPVGRRAVIVGAEHVSFSAILTLRHVGCAVAAMVTDQPRHQTHWPLWLATAGRARIPVHCGVTVARIVGRRRVTSVELSDGRSISCDTVVFTGDWIPDHELARTTDLPILAGAKSPVIDAGFRTGQPGVFAIGNLVHPAETADVCALDGRAVATTIGDWLQSGVWPASATPIEVEPPIVWASHSSRGVTLRVDRFVTGRIVVTSADGSARSGRRRHLIPNRSITIRDVPPGRYRISIAT